MTLALDMRVTSLSMFQRGKKMSRDINKIIDNAKEKLDDLVAKKGLDSAEVLELSQTIDAYIVEFYSTYSGHM